MKKNRSLEDELYYLGLIALIAGGGAVYVIWNFVLPYFPMNPCIIYSLTGIYCPGCGGTRAVHHLLQGHFLKALWYHPLVMYGVVVYGAFMLSHTLRRLHMVKQGMKFRNGYLYGAVGVLFFNCLVKNVLKFGFGICM